MNRSRKVAVCGTVALSVAFVARTWATDYTWANRTTPENNFWQTPSNWKPETGGYPGTGDNVELGYGNGPIVLNDDVAVSTLKNETSWWQKTIDLGGHELAFSVGVYSSVILGDGSVSVRGSLSGSGAGGIIMTNGTFTMKTPIIGRWDNVGGFLDLHEVTLNGSFYDWMGHSRLQLREGSVWNPGGAVNIGPSYTRANAARGHVYVGGVGSKINASDCSLNVRAVESSLFVADGAQADFRDAVIGGSFRSTNAWISVDDATFSTVGNLQIGSDAVNPQGSGTGSFFSDVPLERGAELKIAGTHAKVTVGGALVIHAKTASSLDLTVPRAGFVDATSAAQVPLTAGSLSVHHRNAAHEDMGPTVFRITSRDWCVYHSLETVTLMSFGETLSDDAAAELLGNVQLTDYTNEEIAAGQAPVVEVGADGRSIVLTAPEVQTNPDIAARAQYGTTVGTKKFIVWINGFGAVSSAITSLKLVWSESEDYSVPTEKELLEGGATIVGPLPKVQTYSVAGDFVAHRKYYAKVTATTDEGFASTVAFAFEGDDGVKDTLRWHVQADGDWHDASNWYRNEGGIWVQAGQYPHGEDTLAFAAWDYTITFSDDAEAFAFPGDVTWPGMCYGTKTFELNGHTFRITALSSENRDALTIGDQGDTDAKAKDDLEIIAPAVVFKNGRFEMPGRADAPTSTSPDIAIGAMTYRGSGSLVLDNHANVVADIRYINNSSRFFVKGGSVWRPVSFYYCMNGHTARTPYSLVSVEGEGSRIDLGSYNMIVRGSFAGLYLSNGGRIDAQNLIVGNYGTVYGTGATLASDRTQVKLDNGTVVTKADLELGWTANEKLNPWLVIGGKASTVTVGGALKIHEGLAAKLEFDLPEEGYAAVPLVAGSLSLEALPAGNADRGDATLSLRNVRRWMRQHYEQSMTLVRLATPNAAALELLKSRVTSDCSRVGADNLQVIDGGRELVLTAPERLGLTVILR